MSFALFLRGMLIALAAFAITTYVVTQSAWTTLVWTLGCAVLIQIGYFATVLILVWGTPQRRDGDGDVLEDEGFQSPRKSDKPAGDADRLPGTTRSSHL